MPAQSKEGDDIGYITQIVSGQEHTVCLTDLGQVLVCGSNQHQKLGLESLSILQSQTKFAPVTLNLRQRTVVQVACSEFHTMALTDQG